MNVGNIFKGKKATALHISLLRREGAYLQLYLKRPHFTLNLFFIRLFDINKKMYLRF